MRSKNSGCSTKYWLILPIIVIYIIIYGFLKNRDYKEALIYGVACGSATAQCDDLATIDKIELMLDKINN